MHCRDAFLFIRFRRNAKKEESEGAERVWWCCLCVNVSVCVRVYIGVQVRIED